MVDGFVKIFDEFRNKCDEKSVTITPQLPCSSSNKKSKAGQETPPVWLHTYTSQNFLLQMLVYFVTEGNNVYRNSLLCVYPDTEYHFFGNFLSVCMVQHAT